METISIKISDDEVVTINSLMKHWSCNRSEAIRRAIQIASSDAKQPSTDNDEQLTLLKMIASQQHDIVSLLEPMHTVGGPRKMQDRILHVWTGLWELLTPEQQKSAEANASEVLRRYGLTRDASISNKGTSHGYE